MSNQVADWYSEQEYRERCGMPHEGESMPKQKISNGDRIRQMTDEELARFFQNYEEGGCFMCAREIGSCDYECDNGRMEWLKQEAKQDET